MKIRNKITNTYPIAFHLSGKKRWNKTGYEIYNQFINSNDLYKTEKLRSDTKIIFPHYGYSEPPMVEKSLHKLKVDNTNIAEEYLSEEIDITSFFSYRWKMLSDWSKKNSDFKYIIGQDASDIFFAEHPNRIVEIFENEFQCDALFNAEKQCWPKQLRPKYNELYATKNLKHNPIVKFLNAGLFIAKTEFMPKLYDIILKTPILQDNTDQGQIHQIYLNNYPQMQVDSECRVFQHTGRVDSTIFEIEK